MRTIAAVASVTLGVACCPSSTLSEPAREAREIGDPTQPSTTAGLVAFTIEPIAPASGSDARPQLRLRLRNVSEKTLWLSAEFSASHPHANATVWLEVTDANTGEVMPWLCSGSVSAPRESALYVLLRPGSEYSTVELLECFLPSRQSRVRIVAHYRDRASAPARPPRFASWFAGELISNSVEVEVPALAPSRSTGSSPGSGANP